MKIYTNKIQEQIKLEAEKIKAHRKAAPGDYPVCKDCDDIAECGITPDACGALNIDLSDKDA